MEKGHMTGDWSNIKRIIPYGFGSEAKKSLKKICREFEVPFIIDKDSEKWGKQYCGIEIVSPDKLLTLGEGDKVLVTIAKRRFQEISKDLEKYNLQAGKDFCHILYFITEWYQKYKKEYCLYSVHMALTTACTLKCQHCNMFIPYHKNIWHASVEDVKMDLALLFSQIDYLCCLDLIGGEALLNPNIKEILELIISEYRHKIGEVTITTNAVIIPSKEIREIIREADVLVVISDYTDSMGARVKVDELSDLLIKEGIKVSVMRNRVWSDFCFPNRKFDVPSNDVKKHMMLCDPGWRGLNDGKLYFCHIAWSVEKAKMFKLRDTDYIDLENIDANDSSKKRIIDYSLGKMDTEYMSFCQYCGGCGPDNQNFVLAGEQ